ncbi:Na+/H+ antiporter [Acetobacter suratthaniensis]|uniref:Na+/H+ antiporter n=1 Tax=Acetobacter suratthaniensis TaxID=1502841 RepID=A0ABS3LIP8_9PROT|nr:Na+/H+ antiporter [Acetobacter suratthaniensis]MBO1326880.1 Na+/H+ antiporter [Acetobacter suratthaniensis]MCX2565513.1 Na+/H+ antiporter [Acetobacter suratthaniensis]
MLTVQTVLLLLWLAAFSSLVATACRQKVPQPIILIVLGVGAALCGLHIGIRPELFMFVFLPPLLFADAFRMPLREFREMRRAILFLAFGLVILNTIVCGYIIHWILPVFTLPVCFTLAAALSPTDTVAVSSLLQGRKVPGRLLQLLSGEALFNDASGLVCFRFAMADAMTGEFSYRQAFGTFILVAFGGLFIGALVAWVASRINHELIRRKLDEARSQIVLVLLLPFAMYAAAEAAGCSGILAAVAGCMVLKLSGSVEEAATMTRIQANTVWNIVSYVFNGLIFLFLGLQLPSLVGSARDLVQVHNAAFWQYGLLVVEVYGAMLIMRLFGLLLCEAGRWAGARLNHMPYERTGFAANLLLTFAGVRGAVTLAAVLSLPVGLDGAAAFPARESVVVIATGVIILSLICAGVCIPFCLRFIPPELVDKNAQEENLARQKLIRAALGVLRKVHDAAVVEAPATATPAPAPALPVAQAAVVAGAAQPQAGVSVAPAVVPATPVGAGTQDSSGPSEEDCQLRREVSDRLIQLYECRLDEEDATPRIGVEDRQSAVRHARLELALRLQVLRMERQVMHQMVTRREINDQTEWKLQQELDYEEQVIRYQSLRLPREDQG